MIKLDLKAARLPLILYGAIFSAVMVLLVFFPDTMAFTKNQYDIYKSKFFYWSDFLCPLSAVFCIILQLGNTLDKRCFEMFCSLPEKKDIIIRWGFTVFVLILPLYLTGMLAGWYVEAREVYSFWELLYISGANLAFYSSFSLFLMLIFRQSFYAFCVACGLMFADIAVGDQFLFEYSAFLNFTGRTPLEEVEDNRLMYYIIAGSVLVFCIIFVKSKMLIRTNKLR